MLTPADLDDIKTRSSSFQSVSAWQEGLDNIVGTNGEGIRAEQFLVTTDFFATTGVNRFSAVRSFRERISWVGIMS